MPQFPIYKVCIAQIQSQQLLALIFAERDTRFFAIVLFTALYMPGHGTDKRGGTGDGMLLLQAQYHPSMISLTSCMQSTHLFFSPISDCMIFFVF